MGLLCVEIALVLLALAPTNVTNRELYRAHHRFIENPTQENLRDIERTATRVNRPWHLLQSAAALMSVTGPIVFVVLLRRRWVAHAERRTLEP